MEKVEQSISVLERTIRDTERTRGPALETALQRQLAVRRTQLSVLHSRTRSNSESRVSVIVHTSTPDTSITLGNIFFDAALEIQNPDGLNQAQEGNNFQVYLDPEVENIPPTSEARPPSLSRPPLIEIVETPFSAFTEDNTEPRFVFDNLDGDTGNTNAEMSYAEEEPVTEEMMARLTNLKKSAAKLHSLLDCYHPQRYPPSVLRINKDSWMRKIDDAMTAVTESCLEIQLEDNVPITVGDQCKEFLKDANESFSKFVIELDTKILGDLNLGDSRDARSGSVTSGGGQSNDSVREAEAARVAEIDVNIDHEKISDDVKALSAEINRFEDWSEVESHEIEVAMGKIEGWQKRAKQIRDAVFSMKRSILKYKLDDTRLRAAESSVNYMQAELENVIEVIQFEDESRCLYSLNKKSSAKVSYPKFSGNLDEDFDKFRREMNDAIKTNQVKRSDQVKVIRDNLSDQPKTMISNSLEDVDKAWKILSEIYGGAGRLVKAKKDKLTAMGIMPKPDSKLPGHVRQRVEWLLGLDLIMKDLADLAKTNMDCYCETYNDSTIKKIKSFFPFTIHNKMSEFQGSAKEKFEQISNLVEKLLKSSRSLLADVDGEEVPDHEDKESSTSDDGESTEDVDDYNDAKGGYTLTNQEVLDLLGVSCVKDLECHEDNDDEDEAEDNESGSGVNVNMNRGPSSYFAAVTRYKPLVFATKINVGDEPPGVRNYESLEEIPEEPDEVAKVGDHPLLHAVHELRPEPDGHGGVQQGELLHPRVHLGPADLGH